MIARAFISAAVLFLIYNLALLAPPLRERFIAQSQWQENIIKAQEYPTAHANKRGVIVGSSLAARLSTTSLATDFYNLSFSGDGPFTGLEIIRRDPTPLALVLIESNFILRRENHDVLDNAFRPGFSALRAHLPALREQYQPADFVAGKLGEKALHYAVAFAHKFSPQNHPQAASAANAAELWAKQLASHKAEYQILPASAELDRQIEKLKTCVAELEGKGCRCVFFEMPIDAALSEEPLPALIRNRVHSAFPAYVWVQPEKNFRYATVDGLHLAGPQAEEFATHICATLQETGVLANVR